MTTLGTTVSEFTEVAKRIPSWKESVSDERMRAILIDLFLRSKVRSFRTLRTVSIVFKSELEAEEFLKLVRRTNGVSER